MSKQLILITSPFKCGHCARAIKELPPICEEHGFEFIEMKNEAKSEDNLPVDLYPTIMLRVNGEMKEVVKGFNPKKITETLKKY